MKIELHSLYKSFDDKAVLTDFSYTFLPGITCIFGPSGCGKTTLLRIIAGLIQPDKGTVSGCEGRKNSLVFQEDRLFENLSAVRNVLLSAAPGTGRDEAEILLKKFGINDPYKKVKTFSGGMKRRTAVARALLAPHDILLIDEPCTGLDESARRPVLQAIREDADSGKIVICITHNAADVTDLNAALLPFASEH